MSAVTLSVALSVGRWLRETHARRVELGIESGPMSPAVVPSDRVVARCVEKLRTHPECWFFEFTLDDEHCVVMDASALRFRFRIGCSILAGRASLLDRRQWRTIPAVRRRVLAAPDCRVRLIGEDSPTFVDVSIACLRQSGREWWGKLRGHPSKVWPLLLREVSRA